LDFRSVTENFLELESDLNLFKKKIDNFYFWDHIRWSIHQNILQKKQLHNAKQPTYKERNINFTKLIRFSLKSLFFRNAFISSKREIIFWGHPRRKKLSDELWWDIYCDPIIQKIKKLKCYTLIERPYLNKHFSPPKTEHLKYCDFPYLLADMLRKIKIFNVQFSESEKSTVKKLQILLEKRFDVELEDLSLFLKKKLNYRKSLLFVYWILLKITRPKIVFLICSYDNKIFLEACKKFSVPVLELQHGTSMGYYHLGYSYPKKFYNNIIFPDYLLVFGDFWKTRIPYPISNQRIFSVGYPFFEIEAAKYKNVPKKNQVLFISQRTIGLHLSKIAVELNSINNFPFNIVYKLHPEEYNVWKSDYPALAASSVQVVDDDSLSLYHYFAESKIQVGVYSTAIYEGLGFGLKTILIRLPGIEYMDELIDHGYADVISNADELEVLSKSILGDGVQTNTFFTENSIENINKIINRLINSK
jgi:hypothetical protein